MYYEPCARVSISTRSGNLEFTQVNRVEINESVKELGNKAVIVIPRNYKEIEGLNVLSLLDRGSAVKIELGYDQKYSVEFTGFLDEIESDAPLTLHIDDEFYPWKRNNLVNTFSNVKLAEILKFAFPDYLIECPDVSIGDKFQVSNVSSYQVLLKIQEQFGFYTRLNGKNLSCLWPFELTGDISGVLHLYTFYTYTVKTSDLKYRRREDVKVRVRVTSSDRKGGKRKYEVGAKEQEGSLYSMDLPAGMTDAELKEYGDAWYNRLSFDGYSGTITGFGVPVTHAGDTLRIIDHQETDRQGSYLIDSVKITYDLKQGFERENSLSFKV